MLSGSDLATDIKCQCCIALNTFCRTTLTFNNFHRKIWSAILFLRAYAYMHMYRRQKQKFLRPLLFFLHPIQNLEFMQLHSASFPRTKQKETAQLGACMGEYWANKNLHQHAGISILAGQILFIFIFSVFLKDTPVPRTKLIVLSSQIIVLSSYH